MLTFILTLYISPSPFSSSCDLQQPGPQLYFIFRFNSLWGSVVPQSCKCHKHHREGKEKEKKFPLYLSPNLLWSISGGLYEPGPKGCQKQKAQDLIRSARVGGRGCHFQPVSLLTRLSPCHSRKYSLSCQLNLQGEKVKANP